MSELREHVAKAIWMKKPDAGAMKKPWPLDGKSPKERRTFLHDPPASFELCFIYADAAIAAIISAPALDASHNSGERLPESADAGADPLTNGERK